MEDILQYYTYSELGHVGRLGNQLWQLASTFGLAMQNQAFARFPPEWRYRDVFSVPEAFFEKPPAGSSVHNCRGYLQRLANFEANAEDVRRLLDSSKFSRPAVESRYVLPDLSSCLAMHVRRGDYRQLSHLFHLTPMQYYQASLEKLKDAGVSWDHVLLFSDEVDVVASEMPFEVVPVRPAAGYTGFDFSEVVELYIMSQCKHHVIANSTFSWWGAWLSANPRVCYPDCWATEDLELYHRWREAIPASWLEVPSVFPDV